MLYTYSKKLRDELKAYFLKRYDLVISDEEADEYLESLVTLCDLLCD